MIQLPEIPLPQDFVSLLKTNMNFTIDTVGNVKGLIFNSPNLRGMVERFFSDIDRKRRVDIILNSLGWVGLRDRLASLYLAKFETNEFPHTADLKMIKDLEVFEEKTRMGAVEGFSRHFLLAFYLKAAALESQKGEDVLDFRLPAAIYSHLRFIKAKCIKIDWLILALYHFDSYLGTEHVERALRSSPGAYHQLYELLSGEQRAEMTSNMLSYSFSIDEMETVIPKLV